MEQSIPQLLKRIANEYPDLPAQYYRSPNGEFVPVLYRDFYASVLDLSSALLSSSHKRGDHIGIISDNRPEWFQTSMAIMAIGAADRNNFV